MSKSSNKPRRRHEPDSDAVKLAKVQRNGDLGIAATKAVWVIVVAYFARDAVYYLSGRTTEVSFLVDVGLDALKWIVPLTAGLVLGWVFKRRGLAVEKSEYNRDRIAKLERIIDPNRSLSSRENARPNEPEAP